MFWGSDSEPSAGVYKHMDGYPDGPYGMLEDFERFFDAVEAQTQDTRVSIQEYLAAKYVVYLAGEYGGGAASPERPLGFLSVGITLNPHTDEEYRYSVLCDQLRDDGRPRVLHAPVEDLTDHLIPCPGALRTWEA